MVQYLLVWFRLVIQLPRQFRGLGRGQRRSGPVYDIERDGKTTIGYIEAFDSVPFTVFRRDKVAKTGNGLLTSLYVDGVESVFFPHREFLIQTKFHPDQM